MSNLLPQLYGSFSIWAEWLKILCDIYKFIVMIWIQFLPHTTSLKSNVFFYDYHKLFSWSRVESSPWDKKELAKNWNIESDPLEKLLKFFFCRCREKQRKEASRLQTVNRKLSAMNKLLMEENDRLQKQVSQLVYENGYMRQQLHTVSFLSLFAY